MLFWSVDDMTQRYGPSFAHGRKDFEAQYGDELDLIQITDALVRLQVSAMARNEYLDHHELMQLAKELHREIVG